MITLNNINERNETTKNIDNFYKFDRAEKAKVLHESKIKNLDLVYPNVNYDAVYSYAKKRNIVTISELFNRTDEEDTAFNPGYKTTEGRRVNGIINIYKTRLFNDVCPVDYEENLYDTLKAKGKNYLVRYFEALGFPACVSLDFVGELDYLKLDSMTLVELLERSLDDENYVYNFINEEYNKCVRKIIEFYLSYKEFIECEDSPLLESSIEEKTDILKERLSR